MIDSDLVIDLVCFLLVPLRDLAVCNLKLAFDVSVFLVLGNATFVEWPLVHLLS